MILVLIDCEAIGFELVVDEVLDLAQVVLEFGVGEQSGGLAGHHHVLLAEVFDGLLLLAVRAFVQLLQVSQQVRIHLQI